MTKSEFESLKPGDKICYIPGKEVGVILKVQTDGDEVQRGVHVKFQTRIFSYCIFPFEDDDFYELVK